MNHFFAYLARMKNIKRWGLMRNTAEENIQEHSMQVAVLAHGLALIRNRYFGGDVDPNRVLAIAVYHDVSEVITGDLATPIKYFNPEIQRAYKAIESVAEEKVIAMLPPELQAEYRPFIRPERDEAYAIVKAADRLAAYIKCVEELRMGNQEFQKAKEAIGRDIAALGRPEVDFFLNHFMDSFTLTLDELN